MKKFLLMAVLILSGASISRLFAGQQQDIPMQIIDKDGVGNGHTYAPPRPWYIQQWAQWGLEPLRPSND